MQLNVLDHVPAALLDCDAGTLASVFEVVRAVAEQLAAEHGGAHVVTNLGKYQACRRVARASFFSP